MNKLHAIIAGLCLLAGLVSAHAQSITNAQHTVVRFDITSFGTNFGTLDLELFDQERPETVRNFLLYVYSGSYSNLVIHRLDRDFVVQAGHVKLPKGSSTNEFNTFTPVSSFGDITNESDLPPRLENAFGTIAMGLVGTNRNSGSTDWFINLHDNGILDTNVAGYTVFGRVVNTDGDRTGTNLLNILRTYTNTVILGYGPEFSLSLPLIQVRQQTNYYTNVISGVVTTNISRATPQLRELLTINASIIQGAVPRDLRRPTLAAVTPRARTSVTTNSTFSFSGTARDNQEVARVIYANGGAAQSAQGSSNWSANVSLTPGTNTIYFKSIDWFGNESPVQKRTVFYKVGSPITLDISGGGKIIGATNGQLLDLGRNYSITARPDRNNVFLYWLGYFNPNPYPQIRFMMEEGAYAQAVFMTNYFRRMQGTYYGLMIPLSRTGTPGVTGVLRLSLNAAGVYSGSIKTATHAFPVRSAFNLRTGFSNTGGRIGINRLGLSLQLQTNGVERIFGYYTEESQQALVIMYRETSAVSNFPPAHYTVEMTPNAQSQLGTGIGVGTADVGTDGRATFNLTLQDGETVSTTAKFYAGTNYPIFTKLPNGSTLIGWVGPSGISNSTAMTGGLNWLSSSFTNKVEPLTTSLNPYSAPGAGIPPISLNAAEVELSGDGLTNVVIVPVNFEGSSITVPANDVGLTLTADAATGSASGTFIHPVTQAETDFEAVFNQSATNGAGFFSSGGSSGAVKIRGR